MKNKRLIGYFTLFLFTTLFFGSCTILTNSNTNNSTHTLKYVHKQENEYEGNIVIDIFDEEGNPLTGARTYIKQNDSILSEYNLETSTIVYHHLEKKLSVRVEKKGYLGIETPSFNVPLDSVCFIEFHLNEK